ncbi:MAG: hypothetical protein JNK16_07965 [Phycisphaerales bacterium]|nr:hypothetical protein [Phycisphaerales bacterium]
MRPNRRGRKPKSVRSRRHPATGKQKPAPAEKALQGPVASMGVPLAMDPRETKLLREMLWHNIVREMLTALCLETGQADASGKPRVLDGRLTVITFRGERIPIGAVRPLLNFGFGNTRAEKQLSMMLQGTVFQVITPDGDVFTLPIHEIRGLHALSESIMQELQAAAESIENTEPHKPFGFAAFTSIAQGLSNRPIPQAPDDPSE